MKPAVFLDRDGTLNRERGYVTHPRELEVLPGARAALERLHRSGHLAIVLTNQSGIAKGEYGEHDLARVHEVLHAALGGVPDAYLHCPHHPEHAGPYGGACHCRKPGPGLIEQALSLFAVDVGASWIVGDSARDLLMARELPLRTILVQSGKPWREELAALERAGRAPDFVCRDVEEAARRIAAE